MKKYTPKPNEDFVTRTVNELFLQTEWFEELGMEKHQNFILIAILVDIKFW